MKAESPLYIYAFMEKNLYFINYERKRLRACINLFIKKNLNYFFEVLRLLIHDSEA